MASTDVQRQPSSRHRPFPPPSLPASYHRLLAALSVECVQGGTVAQGLTEDLLIHIEVLAFDGAGGVAGAVDEFTDVYAEIRIDPAPSEPMIVAVGSLVSDRTPPGGYPDYAAASSRQGGLVIKAATSGNGHFEVHLQPEAGYSSGGADFYVAVNVPVATPLPQKPSIGHMVSHERRTRRLRPFRGVVWCP